MVVRKPAKGAVKAPKNLKISSRPADTPEQRDSEEVIYGVHSVADLSREVLRRVVPPSEEKS
jgi:hypothetical protein